MGDNSTYVKLYRKVLKNELFNEKPFDRWHAFEWMILKAYRFPKDEIIKGQVVHIGTGQLILSYRYMADEFGWSVGKVRRFVELLVNRKIISISDTPTRHSIGTLVTIENYTTYQGGEHTDGHTDEHTDGYTDGHTDRHNIKKVKKVKKVKKSIYMPDISEFSPLLQEGIKEWIAYKDERKESYTQTGLKAWIGQIRNKSKTYEDKVLVDVIRRSMASQYKGVVWDWLKDSPKKTKYKEYREEVKHVDTLSAEEQEDNIKRLKESLGGIFA